MPSGVGGQASKKAVRYSGERFRGAESRVCTDPELRLYLR